MMGQVNKIIYFTVFGSMIFVIGLLLIIPNTRLGESSDVCEIHKELFQSKLDSAIVIEKYIDTKNHALETVKIKTIDKTLTIYFIPDVNSGDFEIIQIGDVVSKREHTFELNVLTKKVMTLDYHCKY
jgi:hypothetical protein